MGMYMIMGIYVPSHCSLHPLWSIKWRWERCEASFIWKANTSRPKSETLIKRCGYIHAEFSEISTKFLLTLYIKPYQRIFWTEIWESSSLSLMIKKKFLTPYQSSCDCLINTIVINECVPENGPWHQINMCVHIDMHDFLNWFVFKAE